MPSHASFTRLTNHRSVYHTITKPQRKAVNCEHVGTLRRVSLLLCHRSFGSVFLFCHGTSQSPSRKSGRGTYLRRRGACRTARTCPAVGGYGRCTYGTATRQAAVAPCICCCRNYPCLLVLKCVNAFDNIINLEKPGSEWGGCLT